MRLGCIITLQAWCADEANPPPLLARSGLCCVLPSAAPLLHPWPWRSHALLPCQVHLPYPAGQGNVVCGEGGYHVGLSGTDYVIPSLRPKGMLSCQRLNVTSLSWSRVHHTSPQLVGLASISMLMVCDNRIKISVVLFDQWKITKNKWIDALHGENTYIQAWAVFSFPLCHMCRNVPEMKMVDLLVGKSSPWFNLWLESAVRSVS